MDYYRIEPIDTLFFRDGRPYNAGETQNDVKSIFPPSPFTVVGALRAAMARKMDWKGGPWEQRIKNKLGDGRELGNLNFAGPYLMADDELIFPVPRHILARKKNMDEWENFNRVRPGNDVIPSDMGNVCFPILEGDHERMKNIPGYVTSSDMKKLLWDDALSDIEIISTDLLWKHEFNVGIQRDANSLTVYDGHLFSRTFIRMREKMENQASHNEEDEPESMGLSIISGVERFDSGLGKTLMLGGESKAAFIEEIDELKLPEPDHNKDLLKRFVVVLITPAHIEKLEINDKVDDLFPDHVKLVSVCADRPEMIGGWDFSKGPLPLKPYMKAGSVLFFESEEGIDPKKFNGRSIGDETEFGFGQVLIGKW